MDEELSESMEALPPSKPDTEPTQVSYMRAKATMVFIFGRIVERLHLVAEVKYDEILQLDQALRQCLADLPPHLRMRSLDDSAGDPGALIMQRINLDILYHKGQAVLHRKFLDKAYKSARFADSRRTCIDSAMALLRIQQTLHFEGRPGHRLYGMKPFISSLTTNDFLLAAMILAWDLRNSLEPEGENRASGDEMMWGREIRSDMIRILEVSQSIWKETTDESIESFKADKLLTVSLNHVRASIRQGRSNQDPFPFLATGNPNDNNQAFGGATLDDKPEHSAAMTLGMLSSGGMGTNTGPQYNGPFPTANGDGSISQVQASPDNLGGFGINQLQGATQEVPNPLGFLDAAFLPGMDTSDGGPTIDWVSIFTV